MPLFPSLCHRCRILITGFRNIVEGQFGEMLVGQDGDIMLEASTWKLIQKKLNGKLTTSFWLRFSEDNSNNVNYKNS